MKASNLREMSAEDLKNQLEERKKDMLNFRLQLATGVVDNVRAARTARREIARIKTVLRERELEAARNQQQA